MGDPGEPGLGSNYTTIIMRKLFQRKKGRADETSEKMAEKIATGIIRWQRKWADWMQGKSERLSRRSKLTVLFVSGVAGLAISISILLHAVFGGGAIPLNFGKEASHIPSVSVPPETKEMEDKYNRIRRQKMHLDSLARSPGEQVPLDDLVRDQKLPKR